MFRGFYATGKESGVQFQNPKIRHQIQSECEKKDAYIIPAWVSVIMGSDTKHDKFKNQHNTKHIMDILL